MTTEPITKSQLVAEFIAFKQVPAVFLLSGGMIAFLADAVAKNGKTPIVNLRNEQAAGFAAEGATRVSGKSAVAMGTSGPGATNLVTAVASSYFDSVPTIFITGQVNQNEIKKTANQRQNGFQELDIVQMVKGITKYAKRIDSQTDLFSELERAWAYANEGRSGPVLLDIPIDVQQEYTESQVPNLRPSNSIKNSDSKLEELSQLLHSSLKPIFLLGGGIRSSSTSNLIQNIITSWKIPAVHSLMGIDILPSDSPYRIGLIGSYGNRWAHKAINEADLIIALGTRLDIRQTGANIEAFMRNKSIFRVDIDDYELNGRLKADISVNYELKEFIKAMNSLEIEIDTSDWIEAIHAQRVQQPQVNEQPKNVEFNPDEIMQLLSTISKRSNGYVVDVGQHQMWAAQSIKISQGQRFITSGGLGAMGFSLPAAIGAATALSGRWVVIAGDGCAQLSIAELQTLKHYKYPITICIFNNGQHGMVAQFQEEYLENRFVATREGYSAPNFTVVASAFGIEAIQIRNMDEFQSNIGKIENWNDGPLLIEFIIPNNAKALPKLSFLEPSE